MTQARDLADNKLTGDVEIDGTTLTVDSTNNRVGIGTDSPATYSKLHVNDSSNTFAYTKYTNSTTGTDNADGLTVGISSANALIYNYESGNIQFATAGTERLRILSTGGITFNGDTSTANALDDYEEGTWSPSVATGSAAAGQPRYLKIGNQVTLWFYLSGFSDTSSSSAIHINNLPFTSQTTRATGPTFHRYFNTGGDSIVAYVPQDVSSLYFYASRNNTNYVNVTHNQLSSSTASIFVTITYNTV
jgi:hypothetical protein